MKSLGKTRLIAGIFIGLIVGIVVGYSIAPQGVDTTDIEQQISDLKARVAMLQQQLETEILGVYFSPYGGCEDQILYWINQANTSIHILIYSFTLDSVGDVLINARNRGVDVRVVFEVQQISQYSEYQRLRAAGLAVRNDTNSKLMHNKLMIVDNLVVLTGSFNWSSSGEESNNENLIVIKNSYVVNMCEEEFEKIWSESV